VLQVRKANGLIPAFKPGGQGDLPHGGQRANAGRKARLAEAAKGA